MQLNTRVLHLGRFDSDAYGGPERHVRSLLAGLKDHMRVDNLVAADKLRGTTRRDQGRLYGLSRATEVVISWHSDIVRQEKILSLYRPLLDRLLARADAVIAATPAHFESSTQLHACPSERRHVVSYGAEYSVDKAKDALLAHAARLRAFHGSNRLIFAVGRHVYYKGFDYLIRAMREI